MRPALLALAALTSGHVVGEVHPPWSTFAKSSFAAEAAANRRIFCGIVDRFQAAPAMPASQLYPALGGWHLARLSGGGLAKDESLRQFHDGGSELELYDQEYSREDAAEHGTSSADTEVRVTQTSVIKCAPG
jgi:hypothetical protein